MLSTWIMYIDHVKALTGFSFCVLFVMSIERYLGAYYPIFHRTSVTKRRLLTLLAMLFIISTFFDLIYSSDIISTTLSAVVIFIIVVFLPLLYLNFKLFKISRKVRRRKANSPEKGTTKNLKTVSTCLLVVASLVVLSISVSLGVVFNINTKTKQASRAWLSYIWATTVYIMNCTLNSLIFFQKNKVSRIEGIKILKRLNDRLVRS